MAQTLITEKITGFMKSRRDENVLNKKTDES
jgi:hypothetical protein